MELGPAGRRLRRPAPSRTPRRCSPRSSTIEGEGERIRLQGEIPSAANPPTGLRLPHALSALPRHDLRRAGAAARRCRGRARDALPHPARGATTPADGRTRRRRASRWPSANEDPRGRAARGGRPARDRRARPRCAARGRGARAHLRERRLPLRLQRDRRHGDHAVPRGARARGRGHRRGRRPGRDARASRAARRALVGALVRRLRGVPARPDAPLLAGLAGDGHGRADGLDDAPLARRRARLPLLVPLDVRGSRRGARALADPDRRRRAVRRGGSRRLCGDDRHRRRLVLGEGATGRARGRDRLRRRRAVGDHGSRGRGCRADRRGRRLTGQARGCALVRRDRCRARRSRSRRHRRAGARGLAAAASTTPSRRRAGPTRCAPRSSRPASAAPPS